MPGTSPGMRSFPTKPRVYWLHFESDSQTMPPSARKYLGNHPASTALLAITGGFVMRVFLGMILGALFLVAGVYIYDSMSTSSVANGCLLYTSRCV